MKPVQLEIERLRRGLAKLKAERDWPRKGRRLSKDEGARLAFVIAPNVLDRQFTARRPNQRWIAGFTSAWTAEGWLWWP